MLHIPDDDASAGRQLTITADNWFAALNDGLKRCNSGPVGNISCMPTDDGSVEVRDYVSGKVFYLHPVSSDDPHSGPVTHIEIFGESDQEANDGAVSYRERLVYVPAGMSVTASEEIARDILTANMKPVPDEQLVVAVHVYDHRFNQRPVRPAVVSMAWQQWNPDEIIVDYPLSGNDTEDTGLAATYMLTQDHEAISSVENPVAGEPKDTVTDTSMSGGPSGEALARNRQSNCGKTQESKVTLLSVSQSSAVPQKESVPPREGERKTLPAVASVDGGVMWAFEELQQMYAIKEHDAAAAFIRDMLLQVIPSEACAVMLNTPGKDELYLAAEHGFSDLSAEKIRIPFVGGIVEAALRLGAVLNVEDPEDERFNAEVDLQGNFPVGNVLVAPVAFEGHTFGVIELFNREVEAPFSEEDSNVISYVAGAFAEFICNSLPNREADFTDREFRALLAESRKNSRERKKAAAKKRSLHASAGKVARKDAQKNKVHAGNGHSSDKKSGSSLKTVKSAAGKKKNSGKKAGLKQKTKPDASKSDSVRQIHNERSPKKAPKRTAAEKKAAGKTDSPKR